MGRHTPGKRKRELRTGRIDRAYNRTMQRGIVTKARERGAEGSMQCREKSKKGGIRRQRE